MKAAILSFLGILFCTQSILAQTGQASLLVQSPDGKNVKLLWFFKKWNSDIQGFDIKRKDGLQDWVKLNSEPIRPGFSMKKKLSVSGVDKAEENILKARLFKLLSSRKLKETDDTYFQQLATDETALQYMMKMMAEDYEIALMNGFAYADHTITKKTDYQYGLFAQGSDKLLAKVSWNYGETPDLNMVTEITSRATTKSKGIQVIWNADLNKMKAADVAGFNIYRQGIRLNTYPITTVNDRDPSEFSWSDKGAGSTMPIQYSISAESIFGIEGIIKSYIYDPADHPAEYKKTEVTEVTSLGYYFKEGISVKWNFPQEHERFLKGFYIEKDNMPAGYKQVSDLLSPSVRSFTDKTPSPVNGHVRFRAIAVYKDKTPVPGIERLYNYFPVNEPPAPQNVKAKNVVTDKKNAINITWDPPMSGDAVTDHYNVYAYDASVNKFVRLTGEQPHKARSYTYIVSSLTSGAYRFCVSSVSKSGSESNRSDTIVVKIASLELPAPAISKASLDSNGALIQWQYPDVADLAGFRLFRNKTVVADESKLRKNTREFKLPKPEPGSYDFTIQAISETGVVSEMSSPLNLSIDNANKR